jgi:hypothetical protein
MSSWKRLTAMHGMMGLEEERMKAGNELLETIDSYAWDDGTKRKEDEGSNELLERLTVGHGMMGLEEERMKASNELLETTDSYAWDDGTRRREDEVRQLAQCSNF